MKQAIIFLITIYQYILSPDHGLARIFFPAGICRFYPTCSEYTKQRILHEGVLVGMKKGFAQLLHCHPFARPNVSF